MGEIVQEFMVFGASKRGKWLLFAWVVDDKFLSDAADIVAAARVATAAAAAADDDHGATASFSCNSHQRYRMGDVAYCCSRHQGHRRCNAVPRQTSHVTRHTSHVTRHTSHVTRHTSHVTRHTSHVSHTTSHAAHHSTHTTHHHQYRFPSASSFLFLSRPTFTVLQPSTKSRLLLMTHDSPTAAPLVFDAPDFMQFLHRMWRRYV